MLEIYAIGELLDFRQGVLPLKIVLFYSVLCIFWLFGFLFSSNIKEMLYDALLEARFKGRVACGLYETAESFEK